nr:VPg [Dendrobium chlorotic mosaic virus]
GRKRKNQKLRFRDARDRKVGREVYGDDETIEHVFGSAYTARGKKKGNATTKNLGKKNRKFVNMYGFDPTDYSYVRFLDPLTGHTIDSGVLFDMSLIQDEMQEQRLSFLAEQEDSGQLKAAYTQVKAYFVNTANSKALEVDLTPHNPLLLGENSASVAGYPEREFELRQTGHAKEIDITQVPQQQEIIEHE